MNLTSVILRAKRPDQIYFDASYVKYSGNIPSPVEARRMVALGLR